MCRQTWHLEICDMYVKILKVLGIISTLTITCSLRLARSLFFAVGGSVGVAKRTKEKWKGCHLGYDTRGRI